MLAQSVFVRAAHLLIDTRTRAAPVPNLVVQQLRALQLGPGSLPQRDALRRRHIQRHKVNQLTCD